MGYQKRISSYQNVEFETANPGKLILMLYDRLEKEMKKAKLELEKRHYEAKGQAIVLSQDIIMELNNSLNMDAGPIAANLRSLYLFLYKELNEINLNNKAEGLAGLIDIVKNLHTSWQEIIVGKSEGTSGRQNQPSNVENLSLVG